MIASCEGVEAKVSVTVPSVSSISITPSGATLDVCASCPFTVTPKSSSGTPLNCRKVTWRASNDHVTVQHSLGYAYTATVTGQSPGDADVIVSCEGLSQEAQIHVKSYCETYGCFPYYRVNNFFRGDVDVYQLEWEGSSGAMWEFMITIPAYESTYEWHYYCSPSLVEGHKYCVRVVETGYSPEDYHIKAFSSPEWPVGFPGGPGSYPFLVDVD